MLLDFCFPLLLSFLPPLPCCLLPAVSLLPSTALDPGSVALCRHCERTHSDPHGKNVCAAGNEDACS